MNDFNVDTIDEVISTTLERARAIERENCDKAVYNNSAAKQLDMLQLAKQLLEEGHTIVKHTHGMKVNNKFIVGASTRKWRVDGKATWYWYSKESFARALGRN